MELQVLESNREFSHIRLAGKLDVEGSGEIERELQELTADADRSAIVDMAGVTYLASLGIRLLFTCAKSLAESGKRMVVLNPQPMVQETLMTSGTVNFIPIAGNLDEAVTMLRGG